MRLIFKLTATLIAAKLAIMIVAANARMQREQVLIELERERHQRILGQLVAGLAALVEERFGQGAASAFLAEAEPLLEAVSVRRMPLSERALAGSMPKMPWARPETAANGARAHLHDSGGAGGPLSSVLAPDPGLAIFPGDLAQRAQREAGHASTWKLLPAQVLATLVLSAMVAALLGTWLVARPMQRLIEHARRVSRGDLSSRVEAGWKDELAALAVEMNQMSEQLSDARRKRASDAAERSAALQQLQHSDRLATVGVLASSIAHQLGTPLNVIMEWARMIASGEIAGEETVQRAATILLQAERMDQIIARMLQLSRQHELRRELVDVRPLVRETLDMVRQLARKQRVELQEAVPEQAIAACIDPAQMQHMLLNLTVNAIQAMPQGGLVRVLVREVRTPHPEQPGAGSRNHVCIRVEDDGEGIDELVHAQLFEPFFTTKPPGHGTGLGLSIVQGIVREHGGWLELESRPAEGSRFSVFLPVEATPGLEAAS
jgi:two-component system, NtrC family, sensor kinase